MFDLEMFKFRDELSLWKSYVHGGKRRLHIHLFTQTRHFWEVKGHWEVCYQWGLSKAMTQIQKNLLLKMQLPMWTPRCPQAAYPPASAELWTMLSQTVQTREFVGTHVLMMEAGVNNGQSCVGALLSPHPRPGRSFETQVVHMLPPCSVVSILLAHLVLAFASLSSSFTLILPSGLSMEWAAVL